jgi:hypothetical protein
MDGGLVLVVLAVVFLVGHLALDSYRMLRNLRFLRHVKSEALDGWQCARCIYIQTRLADMRHESIWTAAAVVVLAVHITLDFVG